jgi:hypothetical protein
MTLDQLITRQGGRIIDATLPISEDQKEWRYQCVSIIKPYLQNFGLTPGSWGNAEDYWLNTNPAILTKFDKLNTRAIQAGDILVFRPRHIAIAVNGSQMLEQNGGAGTGTGQGTDAIRIRTIPLDALYGVLRPKNNQGEEMIPDVDHLKSLWRVYLQRDPTPEEIKFWVGRSYNQTIESLDGSPERKHVDEVITTGKIAVSDNWRQQIYDLVAENQNLKINNSLVLWNKDTVISYLKDHLK